jgi:hypothetical protein
MPITFINGFIVPKYRRYGEPFSVDGAPDGGATVETPIDYAQIPYAMGNYRSNSLRLMNTGFGRSRYQMKTTGDVGKAVISFHIKFGVFSSDYNMGESCFFVLRSGYSEGDTSNGGRGLRICELACRKDPIEPTKGAVEIWQSTDVSQQSNYSGTRVANSADQVIRTDKWYFCEVMFVSGTVSVYFDGTLVVQGTVNAGNFNSHGIEWESFGFRGIMVADYVFQEGLDAALLVTPMRVTNLFLARDKITQGVSTGGAHYNQINEARVLDSASYVAVTSGQQELFGMERGYPLGGPVAVCACAIVAGTASGLQALYRYGDEGSLLHGAAFVDTFNRSSSGSAFQDLFYAGALSVLDPSGNSWDDSDWVAAWQAGFEGGAARVHQFVIERLHVNGAGSGARYISF